MPKHILITGATGLVGKQLIPYLQAQGHRVSILSRNPTAIKGVTVHLWNIETQTIAAEAFEGVDTVIHLAGAAIAAEKWTEKRKKELIESRVKSAQLLYRTIQDRKVPIEAFISASAVGYYGNRGNEVLSEDSPSGKGFLAECCVEWENAANEGLAMGIRVATIRIGLILSRGDGLLAAMEPPIKYFVGAPLGSGKQWMPWVHVADVVKIFATAVADPTFIGAYHACAPFPVTNKLLTKSIAKYLNRPVWPLKVPKFMLKALLGERAILALMSNNTFAQKLLSTGYKYEYINLDNALDDIYHR